jgi:hypothetical protein
MGPDAVGWTERRARAGGFSRQPWVGTASLATSRETQPGSPARRAISGMACSFHCLRSQWRRHRLSSPSSGSASTTAASRAVAVHSFLSVECFMREHRCLVSLAAGGSAGDTAQPKRRRRPAGQQDSAAALHMRLPTAAICSADAGVSAAGRRSRGTQSAPGPGTGTPGLLEMRQASAVGQVPIHRRAQSLATSPPARALCNRWRGRELNGIGHSPPTLSDDRHP